MLLAEVNALKGFRSVLCSGCRRWLHFSRIALYDDYGNKKYYDIGEHPYQRAYDNAMHDFRRMKRRYLLAKYDYYKRRGRLTYALKSVIDEELIPVECTFAIIGGGLVGSAVAFWIKERLRDDDMRLIVLEADSKFAESTTVLSPGGIWQQFSDPVQVQMSLFTAEFLRNADEHLRILDNDIPPFRFTPMNSLFLASNEDTAKAMEKHHKMQIVSYEALFRETGASVRLLNKEELQLQFPFMKFDDIVLGSLGLENGGVFDGWQVLSAFRERNISLGVQYIKAKVTGFIYEWNTEFDLPEYQPPEEQWRYKRITRLIIEPQMTDAAPRPISATFMVNCAGAWAGEICDMAGFGKGSGLMSVPVPIMKKKRYAYIVHCPDGPSLDMPYLFDCSRVWCRREGFGNLYMCGKIPTAEEDATIDHSNLDVDYDYFDEHIWPMLAKRIPAFEKLKMKNAWAYYTDENYYDGSPVIGDYIAQQNFFNIAGFSGLSLQHAIPAARAISEKLLDGAYMNIDTRGFNLHRMLRNKPNETDKCYIY
ncbi:unnamed protein product [Soboliphyme baturini]|uniref:FAD-dependent oxidoreductase domain-containing protein 1 n=1 Tax=Soboliphyme baturini TaxID=241478 RepID=A0A183IBG4_9BILA|nr:unnamed protein product [Soboliphyme baturini]